MGSPARTWAWPSTIPPMARTKPSSEISMVVHIIFEDWSPINTRKHSWDSPSPPIPSANRIDGYSIVAPAVDERTKPTGKMAEYLHPLEGEDPKRFDNAVSDPRTERDAYGDWRPFPSAGSTTSLRLSPRTQGNPDRLVPSSSINLFLLRGNRQGPSRSRHRIRGGTILSRHPNRKRLREPRSLG